MRRNKIVDKHQAGGRRHDCCIGLSRRMNEEERTRIPFPSARNALVLIAPTRSCTPYSGAPGVISLDDQGRFSPARLRLEDVEYLPKEAIGLIQRVQIGSAHSVGVRAAIPKGRWMGSGQVQVDDVCLAVGERGDSVLTHFLHGRHVA